ncbi:MAG: MmgE/PrpD family protein [Pseudaminobacter sp.]
MGGTASPAPQIEDDAVSPADGKPAATRQAGAANTKTIAQTLAQFATDLRYEDIPEELIALAKGHFLDTLGLALASSGTDFAAAALKAATELGHADEATALGSGRRLPAASAALVNGTLAHGLDFDDTHIGAIYHASAPAFAATLTVGESLDASGKDLLVSFIVALEIGCRLAMSGAGAFHDRGFHPTSQCGTFAAAAAACKLRGSSCDSTVSALGLCGSMASGILELRESWLKRLHPGWAAHAGIVAAALGSAGFRGPATVFEGPHGFYASHLGTIPTGANSPIAGLGESWTSMGLALKPYPICHFVHSFVDAALVIRGQFDIAEVERIDCPLTPRLQPIVGEPRELRIRPPTVYDALFSVPYAVALAFVKGRVDLAALYDEPLHDPELLDLAARTFCPDDPDSDYPAHFPGEVRVFLKDGRVISRREACSRGTPERRLAPLEIEEKFHRNAQRVLAPSRVSELAEMVWKIEQVDVRGLVAACSANS